MKCHGPVVNFDVPMQGAKGQDQISMCNCQVPRAQGQPDFTEKPKRCTKNNEIPQKPALLMTRASFYQWFFKTRYRIPFLLRCLEAIEFPHIKHRKKNLQKTFEGEKSKRYWYRHTKARSSIKRKSPNHRKAEFWHEFKWARFKPTSVRTCLGSISGL